MFTPRTSSAVLSDDPLTLVLQGLVPADESPQERAQRLALELEARRVSDKIDERLRQERIERRNKKIVKILLLGVCDLDIAGCARVAASDLTYFPPKVKANQESQRLSKTYSYATLHRVYDKRRMRGGPSST